MCKRDCCSTTTETPKRRRSFLGMIVQIVAIYAVLVFTGGTLIHTGHPVAVEAGRLIHTVTLVEPAMYWTSSNGMKPVAGALHFLSNGIDISRYT